jgi:hypothetical protein
MHDGHAPAHDGHAPDVLIVSLGSTEGLRRADRALRDGLQRAGAIATVVAPRSPRERPTLMLTDLAWARATRAAALRALASAERAPRAIIYSSTTAALFWPRPGAIRFDAPASGNRPGRHGLWQRPLEARRLARAPLLLPWSEGALREAPAAARDGGRLRTLVVPVGITRSGGPGASGEVRDIAAVTYAANPAKKGLDRVLEAWRARRRDKHPQAVEELHVTGTNMTELRRAGIELGGGGGGIVLHEDLTQEDYRALVRRARVFVTAPRREDYGISQLEALADGCMLVTTPAPGPYAALPIARELDPRLVGENLVTALAAALDDPRSGYAERAQAAIEPYSEQAVDSLIAGELLDRLLG